MTTDRFGVANRAYNFVNGNRITSTSTLPLGNNSRSISVWFQTSSLSFNTSTGYGANVLFCYGNASVRNMMAIETHVGNISINHYASGLNPGLFVSNND